MFDSEAEFQSAIARLARATGWLVYHTRDSRRSAPGFPDLVLVRERVIFVELKSAKGRVSPEQRDWLDRLAAAGAEAHVWRPADWPRIENLLSRRGGAQVVYWRR